MMQMIRYVLNRGTSSAAVEPFSLQRSFDWQDEACSLNVMVVMIDLNPRE
jgi:hypothetical protein